MVERGKEPDPNEIILDCYRLADRFKQNPSVFLHMPMSELYIHKRYTIRLIDAQMAARANDDDDDE